MFKGIKFLIIPLITLTACTFNSDPVNLEESITSPQESSTTTLKESDKTVSNFELPYKHKFIELNDCNDFLGSNVVVSCITGLEIVNEVNFEDSVTNIVKYGDKFIVVLKNGQIFEYSFENNTKNLVLSIEDKVLRAGEENGLLSFALNPYANEFTISYVSSDNKLVFEIFEYLDEMTEVTSSSKIVDVQSNTYSHYGGKVIWSEYYKCFLGSIGDLSEANFESRLNSSPLDSSKINGKIIGLNCDASKFSEKPNLSSTQEEVNQNIVVSGLRNPWQFFEFRDNLIIFDTGFTQNEELNIAKLSEIHNNFGWPVFEGPKRAEDLDSISNYNLDISYWDEGEPFDVVRYIEKNAIKPAFYYNHLPCYSEKNENCDGQTDIYRAAIIGGGILENPRSDYNFDIFFADYLSQELFSLNFITRELKIYPIENYLYINSVNIFSAEKNQILTTTNTGRVLVLQLP